MLLCYIFIYILHNIYWAVFTGEASPKGQTGPFLQRGEEGLQPASPSPCLEIALGDFQVVLVHVFIPGFLFYSVLINLFIWRSRSV